MDPVILVSAVIECHSASRTNFFRNVLCVAAIIRLSIFEAAEDSMFHISSFYF